MVLQVALGAEVQTLGRTMLSPGVWRERLHAALRTGGGLCWTTELPLPSRAICITDFELACPQRANFFPKKAGCARGLRPVLRPVLRTRCYAPQLSHARARVVFFTTILIVWVAEGSTQLDSLRGQYR